MASIDKRAGGGYRARWREYPGGPQKTRQFGRKGDAERLPRGPFRPFQSSLSPQEAEVIVAWLRDGGYDEVIAQIAAEDPDLANL